MALFHVGKKLLELIIRTYQRRLEWVSFASEGTSLLSILLIYYLCAAYEITL